MKQKVILIFDIGKTNKKYYMLNESLEQVEKEYVQFAEVSDGDGFYCDDLQAITDWVLKVYSRIINNEKYQVLYINFSTYGATLVHLDKEGNPCTPLFNYIKELPGDVKHFFISLHGDLDIWSKETASPYLGMLNAGLQLFWLKYKKPELFSKIAASVFLPQYFSYLLTGKLISEYTGLGCHTGLWNFAAGNYHKWVLKEGFDKLLPPLVSTSLLYNIKGTSILCGAGIHDSSAALITYVKKTEAPFLLLSTGTWSICLNPFNNEPLTTEELNQDCLCYMQPDGKQVKASRFFMGNEFNKWIGLLNEYFEKPNDYHKHILFDYNLFKRTENILSPLFTSKNEPEQVYFNKYPITDLSWFDTYEEAYHHLLAELAGVQSDKIYLALGKSLIRRIYIDGGFAGNDVFLQILRHTLPQFEFIPSDIPLGSSLGAAMVVSGWNGTNKDEKIKTQAYGL